jgi:hypothetical protein
LRRRQKWVRRLAWIVGTISIGALLGFLIPTMANDLTPKQEVVGSVPEAPLARQFINAFAADDAAALDQMKVALDVKNRAARFRSDYSRVEAPVHLGSYVGGGYSVHAYGIHVVRKDGTEDTISWRVFTSGGQVGLILPPNPIEAE